MTSIKTNINTNYYISYSVSKTTLFTQASRPGTLEYFSKSRHLLSLRDSSLVRSLVSVPSFPFSTDWWSLNLNLSPYIGIVVSLSHVWLVVTPWTIAHQALLFMGFPRQKIVEWAAISFSRGSSQPRYWNHVSCTAGRFLPLSNQGSPLILYAAAAAKSLQSCPTLCDPIDRSPPGPAVPGILQARTLEWVAISFCNAWKGKGKLKSLSPVWLLATPWTAVHQAPPSMGFSRQKYWSGVPLPSPTII